ncbi:helix-turn-helix domain-containing protein [Niallia sp. MER TA 168]|uniref:helix-turn-helix domain-containing protein n=1 Tax=Niallia sp. MER TA 168 TaxID=2939568 RepID=UPI0020407EE4|nr:helix-turn-helix transcriptional regulator [Niallia sp. MER TA 168]MCM3360375.1 helix-turn-helix domain-containing protein [Niallia sp. MER TA 168]
MINISEKLRSIRIDKGLSTKELELISGVSVTTISRIESNTQSPTIETLLKITQALDISLTDLFGESASLPTDLISLINTAKKLSPTQRKKVTEMLNSFIHKN